MKQAQLAVSFAVVALGAVACGGAQQMKPEVPSDVTSTTSAAAPQQENPAPAAQNERTEPSLGGNADNNAANATSADKAGAPAAGVKPMAAPTSAPTSENSARKTHAEGQTFTDGEIIGVIGAEDEAERQLARETEKRAKGASVRQLALRVLSDHDDAKLERVERMASLSPAETSTSADLKSDAMSTVQRLDASRDKDVDRACADALASEERRFIRLLDAELIPQAQSPELRTLLQTIRTSVSSRLGAAEATHSE